MPPRENPRLNKSARLGACLRSAGPRALRDPRQLQLQADRPAAGLCGATRCCSRRRRRVGFASGCQAFGHRELLGAAAELRPGAWNPSSPFATPAPDGGCLGGHAADRLPGQGRFAGRLGSPCLTHGRHELLSYGEVQRLSYRVARGARSAAASRPGGKVAVLSGNDPVGLLLRVRPVARRGGVVPDQPAQRGGREPLRARCLRLPPPDLPQRLRAAGRADACRPAQARRSWSASTAAALRASRSTNGWRDAGDAPFDVPVGRRRRDDRRHRRHHRPAQGRDAVGPQPRGDDGADADGLSLRGPARSISRLRRSPMRRACCACR